MVDFGKWIPTGYSRCAAGWGHQMGAGSRVMRWVAAGLYWVGTGRKKAMCVRGMPLDGDIRWACVAG